MNATTWARAQFGHAELGHRSRNRRAELLAAAALRRPGGTVTSVIDQPAEREGAFRFIENKRVHAGQLGRSHHVATARRCTMAWAFVPVDQSTVSVTDRRRSKGFGPCGGRFSKATKKRGAEVMSALVVPPAGAPLGLIAQQWLRRSDEPAPCWQDDCREVSERESALWLQSMEQTLERFKEAGSTTKPWFQLDRGGDCWTVFDFAEQHDAWVTVRSAHDRCLWDSDLKLRAYMANSRCHGSMEVFVPPQRDPKKPPRRARVARLSIHFEPVALELTDDDGTKMPVDVYAVHVVERDGRDDPIEWLLLTTRAVRTIADAKLVVLGYAQRWRIEDFHRAWKSGACKVEASQLRSPDAFCRWATILAAVAARIEELKHLARTTPDAPALGQLTRFELDAAIVLSKTRKFKPGDNLTMSEAVALIAQIGGYTGKSSGGPPGTITISRGLHDVTVAAAAIAAFKKTD